ncbi:MAG TPA: DNA repair protein RecO [Longimicrobiaceae bacterium]|nr:DNA repair protein RecO [Longimicrobiaceae bacterium]
MPLVSTLALVLQAFPYSETSKILRLFTRELGLRSVIAKGARRPRSRFGGLLEPFTEGTVFFYLKEGRDLHTLSGFDLLRSRQGLGRDLTGFAGASLVAELVLRCATEEPHEALYAAVTEALDQILAANEDARERTALAAAWRVVSLVGFAPQAEMCVGCGRELDPDEPVRFDAEGGGAACRECRRSGRILEPVSRRELRRMLGGRVPDEPFADPAVHRALLRTYLPAQLAHERPLRSLELFLQQVG